MTLAPFPVAHAEYRIDVQAPWDVGACIRCRKERGEFALFVTDDHDREKKWDPICPSCLVILVNLVLEKGPGL